MIIFLIILFFWLLMPIITSFVLSIEFSFVSKVRDNVIYFFSTETGKAFYDNLFTFSRFKTISFLTIYYALFDIFYLLTFFSLSSHEIIFGFWWLDIFIIFFDVINAFITKIGSCTILMTHFYSILDYFAKYN